MNFKTDNKEIIELIEIYEFLKYYYIYVISDIRRNVNSDHERQENILSYLNEIELNTYLTYLWFLVTYYQGYLKDAQEDIPERMFSFIPGPGLPRTIYVHFFFILQFIKFLKLQLKIY